MAQFIKTGDLAYWFFRLNGCLNLVNFLIHDQPGREATDVDILAVRFPHRKELILSGRPMKDHTVFDSDEKLDLIIAEVKYGLCNLNGPWTDPSRRNMDRVLYAIGAFPEDNVEFVAHKQYQDQFFENDSIRCRLFAIGMETNRDLSPAVVQLTWFEILAFIHERFTTFDKYKTQHSQWDETGKILYQKANNNRGNSIAFVDSILNQLEP